MEVLHGLARADGMTQDIPFLERNDYMHNGPMKYEVLCPLTETAQKKKIGKAALRIPSKKDAKPLPKQSSALLYQYCQELHKMIGYMWRLDGE